LGDHPTTRLSAAVTHEVVRPGDRVLDVGCGSGVLSIVAALRGADRVVAIDVGEAAREATVDNAIRNDVRDRIDASTIPVTDVTGDFDVVIANILAPVLVSMATSLRRLTADRGVLVMSGVLTGGHDHVIEAMRPMRPIAERHLDGWSAVTLAHEQR
jgi:ribosomal protein L11 methyltransferase